MAITGNQILEKMENENLAETLTKGLSNIEGRKANSRARLYVSNSGYCVRKSVLDANFEGVYPYTGTSVAYMEVGKTLEGLINKSLTNQNLLLFDNYNLPDVGLNLGGRIDAIAKHNNKIYAFEIKSTQYLPKELTEIRHGQNIAQALIYSAVTGLPSALVFFSRMIAKGGKLDIKMFDLGFDVDTLTPVMENVVKAHLYAKNDILPPKPENFEQDKHCRYCPFIPVCYEGAKSHVPETDDETDHEAIEQSAKDFVKSFLSEENISKRRNGVLKHISENGTEAAKKLKTEDWSNYF